MVFQQYTSRKDPHMWMRRWACPLALLVPLLTAAAAAQAPLRVASPDGRNEVTVRVRDGRLYYSLQRDGRAIFLPSLLGFAFRGAAPLRDSLQVTDTARQTVDETWTQPWGEVARVRDHHNELRVSVAETAPAPLRRRFTVGFRTFNDGVGFRYELPAQPGLGEFEITDELTEFALADDARAWWIRSEERRVGKECRSRW